jgi:hypothetical protein
VDLALRAVGLAHGRTSSVLEMRTLGGKRTLRSSHLAGDLPMYRNRPPCFSIDPTLHRQARRERWIPLTDDGGDLRPRRAVEDPESAARDDSAVAVLREESSGSS